MPGRAIRWIGAAAGTTVGFYLSIAWLGALGRAYPVPPSLSGREAAGLALLLSLLGAGLGWRSAPEAVRLVVTGVPVLERRMRRIPAADVLAAALGIVLGLLVAFLLAPSLSRMPWVGRYLPVAASLGLAWFGAVLFVHRREEWLHLFALTQTRGTVAADPHQGEAGAVASGEAPSLGLRPRPGGGAPKVLDTSAIIDGRVADLYRTGFLEGRFIVPTAVLDELRHIADSPDSARRQRGRYGLQVLSTLQKELGAPVVITDRDPAPGLEVDNRLVLLARELGAHVVTTDYNLNKVAELQGVPVLNVNELAGVLRAQYLPGEELAVRIVADGKQAGQGIGYLVDGTMVVVEGGRRFMNEDVEIEVTSSLQTAQGRMIFGRPRANRPERV